MRNVTRRPRIVKGRVVSKTQGRTIRNVIGSLGGQPTIVQLTTVDYCRTAKFKEGVLPKKETNKRDNYKHLLKF